MAKYKHSELTAKLAIDGVVSALAGTVKGKLGLEPRLLTPQEKAQLGVQNVGDTLFYELGDGGVFLHQDGAYTTIWYGGADYTNGARALDAAIQRSFPAAKKVRDEPHETQRGFHQRTYDIKLPNNHLAIVDAIFPSMQADNPKFMVRVTTMAKQN